MSLQINHEPIPHPDYPEPMFMSLDLTPFRESSGAFVVGMFVFVNYPK